MVFISDWSFRMVNKSDKDANINEMLVLREPLKFRAFQVHVVWRALCFFGHSSSWGSCKIDGVRLMGKQKLGSEF